MNMLQTLAAIAVVAGVPLTVVLADQPDPDMKPIVEIVEQLEGKGYGPFIEVSFDDGRWEVETSWPCCADSTRSPLIVASRSRRWRCSGSCATR